MVTECSSLGVSSLELVT